MNKVFTFLLGAAMSQSILAADESPLAQFRALNQAAVQQDIATMDRLLDDHFTLTHITGYQQPKAEWLAEVRSGSMKYFEFKEENTDLKINGTHATLVSQNLVDANIWGARNVWRLQQTVDFTLTDKGWRIDRSIASLY
ncbi:nuclear transport factor 2 family protein [Neisseria perflava]|uniref:nuclear transport factor 2 family protein n=1 Tax=Neisseria perflava TaxID=33053 RepID=UPI0020A1E327|nr:nuclear transport factor 2 family protein [Neisseria perflava]MCP1661318.1 hypothetical protein [Neisseria perflava]MCP1773264.1 hypothetical protein [Neisseria perflava]